MDPLTMVVTLATTALSAAAQMAQASAAQQAADAQAKAAERKAQEERAVAQRQAGAELKKKDAIQSAQQAAAAASGSNSGLIDGSASTVQDLWRNVEGRGQGNAQGIQAVAENKANGMEYEGALARWKADSDARIAKIGAIGTVIGGLGKAAGAGVGGTKTAMGDKYSDPYDQYRMGTRTGWG